MRKSIMLAGLGVAVCVLVGLLTLPTPVHREKAVGIGSTAQGSFSYTSAAAIAIAASNNTSLQMRVKPMTGSSSFIGLLDSGELAFGVSSGPDIAMAYRGQHPFLSSPEIRIIGAIARFDAALIVKADSRYYTLEDARGARLSGEYPGHLISRLYTDGALAAHYMTNRDFDVVPLPNSEASLQALKEGAVDIAFSTIGNGAVQETAASVGGIRYLPTLQDNDADAIRRFQKAMPGSVIIKRAKGSSPGVNSDLYVMGWDLYLTTGVATDDETVYAATKACWENMEDIRAAHAIIAESLNEKYFVPSEFEVPYHDGAIKFYKEVGVWTVGMASRQKELLNLTN